MSTFKEEYKSAIVSTEFYQYFGGIDAIVDYKIDGVTTSNIQVILEDFEEDPEQVKEKKKLVTTGFVIIQNDAVLGLTSVSEKGIFVIAGLDHKVVRVTKKNPQKFVVEVMRKVTIERRMDNNQFNQ